MDPNDLPARLRGGERFLLDGGVGSELIRLGLEDKPGVVHGPGVTRQVHENYLGAGVDLLTTDSFTTNRYVLRRFKHPEERMADYTRQAVEIAREARERLNPKALIVGSMSGPGFENIEQEYADQAEALVTGGVDVLQPEYTSFINCAPAVRAATRTDLPVFLGVRHVTENGCLDTGHTIQEVIDSFDGNQPTPFY
jgi:methionine synthase I (cobalamin-dependent)